MRDAIVFILAVALVAAPATAQTAPQQFSIASADGVEIHGQADAPGNARRGAVIFIAGTGLFDRDAPFGRSGTPRDHIFADLAQRMNARGLATVRYDRRGLRYGAIGVDALDTAISVTSTTTTQREDLAAVYEWARGRSGLHARCVIFFAHSEGLLHVGRLAASRARAPRAIIAMGGLLESPRDVVHWQLTERDALSLRLMDGDHDGAITNAEVEANFLTTPSGSTGRLDLFLHPNGGWTAEDLVLLTLNQNNAYEQIRAMTLSQSDDAPYPNSQTPMARYSWWKSWFTDDASVASLLTHWRRTPMIFHYGDRDSQTNYERQRAAAADLFGQRATFTLHTSRGHSLGEHPLLGPIDETIADQIANEAAQACD